MSLFENREFTIDQRLLSIRNTYVIKDRNGEQLGLIKKELVSWGPHFWFEDNSGAHVGEIDGKVLTVHHQYDIKGKDGLIRASVKKKVLKLFGSEWWMQDNQGKEVARIKGNIVHHTYDIVGPDKSTIAKVHKNWVTISDEFCVEISRNDFDPLLVLGYVVAMDDVEHPDRSGVKISMKSLFKLPIR